MKIPATCLVLSLLSVGALPGHAQEDRLQIGFHGPESPLGARSGQPTIQSVQWSDGDLGVVLTQAAPCGNVFPVNPVWEKSGRTIVLRYAWSTMPEEAAATAPLCLKRLQAWVFRVPGVPYTVLLSDSIPLFGHGQ
ncbi:hypothetical protein [Ideonella oryzae]|uniref:Uncharacterized protein n=1 Tax=Ideonella oryzae TaxID=2937441 RepID=A0ABT1BSY9_9BURK|nr:hypothetical protein [Ideonella oryzae]MCO5978667.1 hypothetical protein [Ideonella oryzae]